MLPGKKAVRDEIKRMKASMKDLQKPEIISTIRNGKLIQKQKKKINPNLCLKCRQDPGKNFIFVYKANHELKGKVCTSCHIKMQEEKRMKENEKIINEY